MPTDFPFDAVRELTFTARPRPLSAAMRPLYRIALLLLVLRLNCQSGTASLFKLQFFNWVLKDARLRDFVKSRAKNQSIFDLAILHMDPMVNLALKYAYAEGLLQVTSNSKFSLTDKGRHFTDSLLDEADGTMTLEREFLGSIGTRISEVSLTRDLEQI